MSTTETYIEPQGIGDCFMVAARYVIDRYVIDHGTAILCHGKPLGQGPLNLGERYWHAWVETADGQLVIEKSNGNDMTLPAFLYYAIGKIDTADVKRYTAVEAATLMLREGHFGPWGESVEPVERGLCQVPTEGGTITYGGGGRMSVPCGMYLPCPKHGGES